MLDRSRRAPCLTLPPIRVPAASEVSAHASCQRLKLCQHEPSLSVPRAEKWIEWYVMQMVLSDKAFLKSWLSRDAAQLSKDGRVSATSPSCALLGVTWGCSPAPAKPCQQTPPLHNAGRPRLQRFGSSQNQACTSSAGSLWDTHHAMDSQASHKALNGLDGASGGSSEKGVDLSRRGWPRAPLVLTWHCPVLPSCPAAAL